MPLAYEMLPMRGEPAALEGPIVILGAARSGTKMLRDVLAAHPSLTAVPHDINFVWKYGNYDLDHDELTPAQLTPDIARYIRSYLSTRLRRSGARHLVEKTVSKFLRVEFVKAVLPNCRLLHLIRDGRDVAASARRMWRAPAEWSRLVQKLRLVPLRAIPRYGSRYIRSYWTRAASGGGGTTSWGPRFEGIDEAIRSHSLLELCGLQWSTCVEATLTSLEGLPLEASFTIRYEELVRSPEEVLEGVFGFLGLDLSDEVRLHARKAITPRHVGKSRHELTDSELSELLLHIERTLTRVGYSTDGRGP